MIDPRDTFRADLELIQTAGFVFMEGENTTELRPPMEFFVYKTHEFVRDAMQRGQVGVVCVCVMYVCKILNAHQPLPTTQFFSDEGRAAGIECSVSDRLSIHLHYR
jgi:hypothetical protein